MKTILAVSAACLALAACATPFKNDIAVVDASAQGANLNPSTGATAGAVSLKGHFVPATTPDGKTVVIDGHGCPLESYAILKGNATASATSTAPVSSPQIAVAANSMSATGYSAVVAATGGGTAPTPEALNAGKVCGR